MFFGFLVLIFGILMLLDRMGIIYGDIWDFFWPACIIAFGIQLILEHRNPPRRG